MILIEAPNEKFSIKINKYPKIFLGGGISNCKNWQKEVIEDLKNLNIVVYNPRRENFDSNNSNINEEQIVWEYNHLKISDIITFWFSQETLNPITLFELGRWGLSSDKKIIIGVDPNYARKEDVKIQTMLSRPEIQVTEDFNFFKRSIVNSIELININRI